MKTPRTEKAINDLLDASLINRDKIYDISYFEDQVIISMEHDRYNLTRLYLLSGWTTEITYTGLISFEKHWLGQSLVFIVG